MTEQLETIAYMMVDEGKGILAADESFGTIKKRFDQINIESTEETRRDYREMLFRSEEAMKNYISGVILFNETLMQNAKDGTPLVQLIADSGAVPGIKVDVGAKPLAGSLGELVTEGLDGLRDRFAEYYDLGARFAKWRAVITIGEMIPSNACLKANCHALARYAALAQEANIVPIVEPEVLMDGLHDINECFDVTEATLKSLFDELYDQNVHLEGIVLKPNMVISGTQCEDQASVEEIAEQTVLCLMRTVPAVVPGVSFLSGGQTEAQASQNLSAMNEVYNTPWKLTFSYGRALQQSALQTWGGKDENIPAAQAAFTHRAKMNSLAAQGKWSSELEQAA